jgi:hypothetical protein
MPLHSAGGWFTAPYLNLWVLIGTAGTLFLDVMVARVVLEQARTVTFATTQGTILDSRVDVDRDEITTYSIRVKYQYQVDGKQYENSRYRIKDLDGTWHWTKTKVAELPVGAVTTVYYDPARPADSALMVGLALTDLVLVIFILPFNLFFAVAWMAIVRNLAPDARLPRGMQLIQAPSGSQRLRFPGVSLLSTLALTQVVSTVAVLVALTYWFEPLGSIWPAVVGGLLILGSGVAGMYWVRQTMGSGEYDLVIDDSARTVTLPHDPLVPAPVVPLDDLRGVEIVRETTQDSDANDVHTYHARFRTRDGRLLEICPWNEREDAALLGEWLAQRLRVAPPAPPAAGETT